MNTVIVHYRLQPGREAENTTLVKKVFTDLERKSPPGVAYASFQSQDQVTFFHIAFIDNGMENPIPGLPAFKEFQKALNERCTALPVATAVTEVGSYNFTQLVT